MPFRLVGVVNGRELSISLPEGESRLGASAACELIVDHPTVSRRHARCIVRNGLVEIIDENSHNGTFLDGKRVQRVIVAPGGHLAFGKACFVLEEVPDFDLILGMKMDSVEDILQADGKQDSTVDFRSMAAISLELVSELLHRLENGEKEAEIARVSAAGIYEKLPVIRVEVRSSGTDALLFEADRNIENDQELSTLVASGGNLEIRVQMPRSRLVSTLQPLFDMLSSCLSLADREQGYDQKPRRVGKRVPRPAPPTVVSHVKRIYDEAEKVAEGHVGVLIGGPSGTGKEVLARFIHEASPRRNRPFVTLNCAALPRDLLEAELFGIEQGVATGVLQRPGKFEAAHEGTLFLDEIADMSLETQAKILRVLQQGEVYRLGSGSPRPASCRIIAASNKDLEKMRAEASFREDLYYRIAVWVVELPPLKHRKEDIPNLAAYFLSRAAHERGMRVRGITRGALDVLKRYPWPGNIRQLENEMARVALFLQDGDALESRSLSPHIIHGGEKSPSGPLEERLEEFEKSEILSSFMRCEGNASAVARELGIGRSTLYRRMKALGIEKASETESG